jgi:hypothetical protein
MWLFTRYGFYSAVCAHQAEGRGVVDLDRVMVRARSRIHLERLIARFPDILRDCTIVDFAGTDYAFRIFVSKTDWSKILVSFNEEIDYDNFKDEVARVRGGDDSPYEESLHKVWSVMRKLQNGGRLL